MIDFLENFFLRWGGVVGGGGGGGGKKDIAGFHQVIISLNNILFVYSYKIFKHINT